MIVTVRRVLPLLIAACAALVAYVVTSSGSGGGIAHAADTTLVHVKAASLTDQSCNGSNRVYGGHFVINQISNPPASITVIVSGGDQKVVPLSKQTRSVAQYTVTFNRPKVIKDATAYVPSNWRGQFVLSNYICGPSSTSSSPSAPSSSTMTS